MSIPIRHKYADLIMEKARQDATGETLEGWWQWSVKSATEGIEPHEWVANRAPPNFFSVVLYRYAMTKRHPGYPRNMMRDPT